MLSLFLAVTLLSTNLIAFAKSPNHLKSGGGKQYIIATKTSDGAKQILKKGKNHKQFARKNQLTVELTASEYNDLKNDPQIRYIEEDALVTGSEVEATEPACLDGEETEPITWNLKAIGADIVHQQNLTGEGVKVAILDSGLEKFSEVQPKGSVSFLPDEKKTDDPTGHGTSVSGIIGAPIDGWGIIGVAPKSELYIVQVLNEQNSSPVSRIIEGIDWCIDNDIDIINMSFGTSQYSHALEEAVQRAYAAGILLVAAAGNGGASTQEQYPARYAQVLSVGSVDSSMSHTDSSSLGEVSAPGERILTTGLLGLYGAVSGTSISAPHVAGAAAVLLSKDTEKNGRFIRDLLIASAKPLDETGTEGEKLIDLVHATFIYDELSENYEEDGYQPPENNTPIDTYEEDDNHVEGSWGPNGGHSNQIDFGASLSGVSFSGLHIALMKQVGTLVDNDYRSRISNAGFSIHAGGAYVVHAHFLYEMARKYYYSSNSFTATSLLSNGTLTDASITSLGYVPAQFRNTAYKTQFENLIPIIVDLVKDSALRTTGTNYSVDITANTTASRQCRGIIVLGMLTHLLGDTYAHRTIVPKDAVVSAPSVRTDTKFGTSDFLPAVSGHPLDDTQLMKASYTGCKCWNCLKRRVELGVMSFGNISPFVKPVSTSFTEEERTAVVVYYEDGFTNGAAKFHPWRLNPYSRIITSMTYSDFFATQTLSGTAINGYPFYSYYDMALGGLGEKHKLASLWDTSEKEQRYTGVNNRFLTYDVFFNQSVQLCSKGASCPYGNKDHYVVKKDWYKSGELVISGTQFPASCTFSGGGSSPSTTSYVSLCVGNSRAISNGTKTLIDDAGTVPYISSGKTMVPVRFISTTLGGKTTYINATSPITIVYGTKTVTLTIGSTVMKVVEGGTTTTYTLDVPAQLKGSKTYIPLRAVGQALGFTVFYENDTRIILVYQNNKATLLAEASEYIR